jgi:large conductance mechanosensitive channel
MKMFKEFKDFAMKGNLIDMAVAFVMGAAFGKLVTSFIQGIVMPVIGVLSSGVDFNQMKYVLSKAKVDAAGVIISPESSIKYGEFITVTIDFVLVAFFMFILIKAMNKAKRKKEEIPATTPEQPAEQVLLTEIRDLLKK